MCSPGAGTRPIEGGASLIAIGVATTVAPTPAYDSTSINIERATACRSRSRSAGSCTTHAGTLTALNCATTLKRERPRSQSHRASAKHPVHMLGPLQAGREPRIVKQIVAADGARNRCHMASPSTAMQTHPSEAANRSNGALWAIA